ncbi:hypothetical protein IFR05_007257 [Cadophora sp. M221]|nr:hypothetical protein IFR05_007257 [Cadophora sp. M221]
MVFRPPRASSATEFMSPFNMATSTVASILVACMLTPTWALQVSPNSACASVCVDSLPSDFSDPNVSNTIGSDIVCNDGNYGHTSAGAKFEGCLNCLQTSTASSGNENDQGWYFYNLRYAFNTCIFSTTNASDSLSTPCSSSTVCEPLRKALSDGMGTPLTTGQYSYCSAYDNSFLGSNLDTCRDCLRFNNNAFYLSNFLTALQAGCTQRPPTGFAVGLNATVFSKTQVKMTSASASPGTKEKHGLSQGAIIGIAVTGAVLLLILIAIAFVCVRRRRNARRLKQLQSPLDERFGAENITAPHHGAYSSPQTSPPFKEENVQMSRAPKVRNFSLVRQLPQRAGEWQGTPVQPSPHSTNSSSPPLYSPPRPNRDSIPAHHAYIPPEYTPPSRNSTSPLYFPPPPSPPQQPPQPVPATHPQRTPPPVSLDSAVRNTLPSGPRASIARNTSNASHVLPTGPGASVARNPSNAPTSLPGPPPLSFSHSRNVSNVSSALPGAPPATVSRNPSTTSRLQTQNLGQRRGFVPTPVQISGPIVKVGNRFESEAQARKNRERLYKEGIGGSRSTDKDGERPSPESDTSEEMWPGSY